MRGAPPFVEGEWRPSCCGTATSAASGSTSRTPADLEVFWELVDGADVVLENFRPGVMERLGLGWEALQRAQPAAGAGLDLGLRPDRALCQARRLRPDDPGDVGPDVGDRARRTARPTAFRSPSPTSAPASISPSASWPPCRRGRRPGEGQWVETSLLEATVSLGVYEAANYFANGMRPEKLGQAHRGSSPYQVFQTADGWLTIGGAQQNFFRKLCALIGKPELADDPRFKTNADRVKNNDADRGHPAGRDRQALDRRLDGGARGRGHSGRAGAASRRGLRRSADPGARHGGRGRACQGRPAEDAGRAAQDVGDAGRRAPCRADARPARRRDPGRGRGRARPKKQTRS